MSGQGLIQFGVSPRATISLTLAAKANAFLNGRKTVLSAKQWAIKSLNELNDSRALKDNDTEQIYVRVVTILRSFFQEQFGISAPRLTTDEFLSVLQSDDRLSARIRGQLKELLTAADLVKFAGLLPDGDGLATVINQANQLVENAPDAAAQTPTHRINEVDTISRTGESQSAEETN